ncbi:hypothetical protein BDV40DRAFT_127073 [Aspergillus tamarii]|uniref:Uncharacterized protein n=1 Tax=Aspergillus tamarii TaxID=41984 RepID=A0A5N6UZH3_ASPTM|nr:hypothetical protein BDV40DRAFT_127073 [Aspergillus tamarii]
MIYITSHTDTFPSSILIYILQCLHTVLARAVNSGCGFQRFLDSIHTICNICMKVHVFHTDAHKRRRILHYASHSILFLIFSVSANSRYSCKQIVILLP